MDGNGRWATRRGQPRVTGHLAGANAVRRVVEAAPGLGIRILTLYAFSADNWQRPPREVAALMRLFRKYLSAETARLVQNGVRLTVIGRRDRLAAPIRRAIVAAEEATTGGTVLDLRLAIDYSGREAILRAAARVREARLSADRFAELLGESCGEPGAVPDVDLVIRTGGEQRLSDFLLWESAYAELHFTPRMWPDFGPADLALAVRDFQGRDRRFGRVREAVAG